MFKFGRTSSAGMPGQFSTKEMQRIQRRYEARDLVLSPSGRPINLASRACTLNSFWGSRFLKLSQDRQRVAVTSLQSLPELAGNPFAARLVTLFDTDRDGFVTLDEFIHALQTFRNLNHPEDKLKCMYRLGHSRRLKNDDWPLLQCAVPPLTVVFRLYDLDNDGYVGEIELIETMKQVQQHLSHAQLEQVCFLLPTSNASHASVSRHCTPKFFYSQVFLVTSGWQCPDCQKHYYGI